MGANPRLTRDTIVACAQRLLEHHGIDGFALRDLAAELGVTAPSLYTHFASKQDILDSVAVRVTQDVNTQVFAELPWDEALYAWGRSFYESVCAHPKLIPIIAASPHRRPELLSRATAIQTGLVRGGWPPPMATKISWMVRYLVLGASVTSPSLHFDHDPATYDTDYPVLAHLPRLFADEPDVDFVVFDQALRMLVRQLVETHPSRSAAVSAAAAGSSAARPAPTARRAAATARSRGAVQR